MTSLVLMSLILLVNFDKIVAPVEDIILLVVVVVVLLENLHLLYYQKCSVSCLLLWVEIKEDSLVSQQELKNNVPTKNDFENHAVIVYE